MRICTTVLSHRRWAKLRQHQIFSVNTTVHINVDLMNLQLRKVYTLLYDGRKARYK